MTLVVTRVETFGSYVAKGQSLGVSAEQDVDAPAGHVGGHRDGSEPSGLGDDLGLASVLLGVEHLVGDASLVEQALSFSDFSTEIVPTSTGWTDLVALDEILDTGPELGVSVL